MSYKEWKKIYYPKAPRASMSTKAALDHSIKKWSGLDKKTLEEFGLTQYLDEIHDDKYFGTYLTVDSGSCALCEKFVSRTGDCEGCPLYIVRGAVRCDFKRPKEKDAPFNEFVSTGNPKPMQKWLAKAKKMLEDG